MLFIIFIMTLDYFMLDYCILDVLLLHTIFEFVYINID